MRYLGINNAEEYLDWYITNFKKTHKQTKIKKILVPIDMFEVLQKIEKMYSDWPNSQTYKWTKSENINPYLYWNGIPVEKKKDTKTIIIVPEGTKQWTDLIYEYNY